MFTGDRDLVQLVDKNGPNHTILFSPAHKKLYTYQGFSEWLNTEEKEKTTTDIFDMLKVSSSPAAHAKKLFSTVISKKKVSIIEVDPEEFRFRKVLTGDAGDNVPPAYYYTQKNRRYGISEKKATAIIDEFKQKHGSLSHMYLYEEGYITDLANITIRQTKAKHMSREQIISNIKSNVILHTKKKKIVHLNLASLKMMVIIIKMIFHSSLIRNLKVRFFKHFLFTSYNNKQ